jgi:hypothetical protein
MRVFIRELFCSLFIFSSLYGPCIVVLNLNFLITYFASVQKFFVFGLVGLLREGLLEIVRVWLFICPFLKLLGEIH